MTHSTLCFGLFYLQLFAFVRMNVLHTVRQDNHASQAAEMMLIIKAPTQVLTEVVYGQQFLIAALHNVNKTSQ